MRRAALTLRARGQPLEEGGERGCAVVWVTRAVTGRGKPARQELVVLWAGEEETNWRLAVEPDCWSYALMELIVRHERET